MDLIGQRDGGPRDGAALDAGHDGDDRGGAAGREAGATILAFPKHRVRARAATVAALSAASVTTAPSGGLDPAGRNAVGATTIAATGAASGADKAAADGGPTADGVEIVPTGASTGPSVGISTGATPAVLRPRPEASAAGAAGESPAQAPKQAMLFEFPVRPDARDMTARLTAELVAMVLEAQPRKTPTTSTLAVLGGIAGFAAQQSLMLRGNPYWGQPMRAAHLDRMLVSDAAEHASLWLRVREMAQSMGQTRLPDPEKLLLAAQKCVGTTQLGVVTLPPQHRLQEQPQTGLTRLWARARSALDQRGVEPYLWPGIAARAAAEQLSMCGGKVPVHVAVRITMQAACGMALIDPKKIPGAALRPA